MMSAPARSLSPTLSYRVVAPRVPMDASPTIKGVFVNSHVEAVRRARGDEGVAELSRLFGGPIDFRATSDVLVRDEVRLIEYALDLIEPRGFEGGERAYQAGRLHFRDFSTTPWAKMIFSIFPRNFRYMMLHCGGIAEMVFKGVSFESEPLGPNAVRVAMDNTDYPVEHFQGLFHQWMEDFGLNGTVEYREPRPGRYEYVMRWE